jgi:hypothetical protein
MFDQAPGGFYNEAASGMAFRRNPDAGPSPVRRETIPFTAVPSRSAGKRAGESFPEASRSGSSREIPGDKA